MSGSAPVGNLTQVPVSVPLRPNREVMEIDLKKEISMNHRWYGLYKLAAVTLIVGFAAIAVSANILVGIFFSANIPVVLFGTSMALYFFWEHVYDRLSSLSDKHAIRESIEQAILDRFIKLSEPLQINRTARKLNQLGINNRVENGKIVLHNPPEGVTVDHYLKALARYDYYIDSSTRAQTLINRNRDGAIRLRGETNDLRRQLMTNRNQTSADQFKIKKKIDENEKEISDLRIEAFVREEDQLLTGKVMAAYVQYILQNPLSECSLEECGSFQLFDFTQRRLLEDHENNESTYYTQIRGQNFVDFKKSEIKNWCVDEICQHLFYENAPQASATSVA